MADTGIVIDDSDQEEFHQWQEQLNHWQQQLDQDEEWIAENG